MGGCALLGLCGAAAAGPLPPSQTFSLSNGLQSASAVFTFTSGSLDIVLTNTMTTNDGPNWLTGLFFDIGGPTSPILAPTGAPVDGSLVFFLDGSGPLDFTFFGPGKLWAFRQGVPDGEFPQDAAYGLGAAGLDVFGMKDILESGGPSPQPGGSDGGIVPSFDGVTVPPGHFGRPFAFGSLTFHFDLPGGFNIADASVENVSFVFGTGFDEVVLIIPLPAALPMGLLGLGCVVVLRRLSLRGRKAAA